MSGRDRERLRQAFQPTRVRMLFVGEAPPASGRFFYNRDSGLYRAMRDAFGATDENFLDIFQNSGCYLVDLCGEPVDNLDSASRRRRSIAGEPRLAKIIAELQPERIATLLRSIEPNVKRAASRAAWNGPFLHLPYPGRWISHKKVFTALIAPEIHRLLR